MEIFILILLGVILIFEINNLIMKFSKGNQIDKLGESLRTEFYRNREELSSNLKDMGDQQTKMLEKTEQKLDEIRKDNNEKLEKMRETVDEKLHKTLEDRLNKSFTQVSERLEQVHKGLGEMQLLAEGVGDLKKVLSNVKTRGVLGELLLSNILEQILIKEQYEENVKVKSDSSERVEFAIKLPGKDRSENPVWLPIDSKFPLEVYSFLVDAYEKGDIEEIEKNQKELEKSIKSFAKDISTKYISPPETTDFAIMFLPIEGLYAEVARIPGLLEILQREYKITIAGPSNLAAMLNSLQMGFKTLAIEKRSSEVWKILGAVKTEFNKFGDILETAKKRINQASNDIDQLVGTRTRVMQRKLKEVEELPMSDSTLILEDSNDEEIDSDDSLN